VAPRRRRHWRWLLPLLVVLIGLVGWAAGRRVRYHQVASSRLTRNEKSEDLLLGCGITPCLTGYCVREDAFVFTLRDWEKGQVAWQVSTNVPYADKDTSPVRWTAEGEFDADVSPDGHCFVAASSEEGVLHVQSWRDGKALGDAAIDLLPLLPSPSKPGQPAQVKHMLATITDGGRCFATFDLISPGKSRAIHTCIIEGSRILAHDRGTDVMHFSPDGGTVYRASVMAGVGIEGKKLRFQHPLKLPEGDYHLAADGTAVRKDGGIYRFAGKPTLMKGFTCDTITTSGRYALLTKGKVSRVVELKTGTYWEVTVPRENHGGDVTEDGRHLLAIFSNKPGGLGGIVKRKVAPGAQDYFIALYDKPNRLRAWMRIDNLRPNSWWPSPDGRAVVFTTDDKCLLYRLSGKNR